MRCFYIILLFFSCLFSAHAQSPKTEVRAVWLTTIGGIDWPHSYNAEAQKAELSCTLDQLKQAGVNTVLLLERFYGTEDSGLGNSVVFLVTVTNSKVFCHFTNL